MTRREAEVWVIESFAVSIHFWYHFTLAFNIFPRFLVRVVHKFYIRYLFKTTKIRYVPQLPARRGWAPRERQKQGPASILLHCKIIRISPSSAVLPCLAADDVKGEI